MKMSGFSCSASITSFGSVMMRLSPAFLVCTMQVRMIFDASFSVITIIASAVLLVENAATHQQTSTVADSRMILRR